MNHVQLFRSFAVFSPKEDPPTPAQPGSGGVAALHGEYYGVGILKNKRGEVK
jgi:hypothetical protein